MIQTQAWSPRPTNAAAYHGVRSDAKSPPPFPSNAAFLLNIAALDPKKMERRIQIKAIEELGFGWFVLTRVFIFLSYAVLRPAIDVQMDTADVFTYYPQKKQDHAGKKG